MQNDHSAMVLEGGSLRGLFTAGVLDVMMENEITYPYVNGVSAGAMGGMSFISGQITRTKDVNIDYRNDHQYIGIRNLLFRDGIFNFEYLFHVISEEYNPFDWDSFYRNPTRFAVVATNCRTGGAEYFEKGVCKEMETAASASSSMPLLAHMIKIQGEKYLDGGVAMPIAYGKPLEEGYQKVVVVLTREHGYRKKPVSPKMMNLYAKFYGEYPYLLERLRNVPEHYNEMQLEMDRLQEEGKIFLIRPEYPVKVKRIEKDKEKLEELYQEGRRIMTENLEKLKKYLEMTF